MKQNEAMILLVEDEAHLAEGIKANLLAEGYRVCLAQTGPAALEMLAAERVDLVVLDVMLPGKDGFAVCKEARAAGFAAPILFLSARANPEERVLGLKLGGDDYLGKPFYLAEFLGRIEALLRRAAPAALAPAAPLFLAGPQVRVDFQRFVITYADGRSEDVPHREMAILKLLHQHQGEVVSREQILDAVWGHDVYPSSRTVDNFIVRLRRRLETDPADPRFLHTVRGVGYRLTHEEEHVR